VSGEDFVSGTSGQVFGVRRTSSAVSLDALLDAVALVRREPWRLRRAARAWPARRVLALAVERDDAPNLLSAARRELESSHHHVRFASKTVAGRGKFENLNALVEANLVGGYDWLVLIDDDVALPHGFLDAFLFLAERFDLSLAQPAHRRRSHAAWDVTRRRAASVVRLSNFVEIGPVVAMRASTFDVMLPFPRLRIGWGLDLHWSQLARERGWRLGIVDATPVRHGLRRIASAYDRSAAFAEAREFLADRPYVTALEAQQTLATYRSW